MYSTLFSIQGFVWSPQGQKRYDGGITARTPLQGHYINDGNGAAYSH
jgi:hypothetical protein